MAMTDLTIVRRSLAARLFSTATTALTVAVAVSLMLVLLSMRDTGRRAFERGSGNMHLLVSADVSPLVSVLNGVFYANAPSRPLTWTQHQRIAADPRLAYAIPVQQGDSFRGYAVMATVPEFFRVFSPDPAFDAAASAGQAWPLADGRFFERPFEVVLGHRVRKETGLGVGDSVHLAHGLSGVEGAHIHDEHAFTVVGLLGATGAAHDRAVFIHLESSWIVHAEEAREAASAADHSAEEHEEDDHDEAPPPAEDEHEHGDEASHPEDDHDHHGHVDADDLAPAEKLITGIYIRGVTRDGRSVSTVVPTVASELRRDPRLTVAEPSKEIDRLFRIVSSVDMILVAMAAVVMVSSGIAIMLALYNSMEQRRRQVAVLRVLGCSAARVVRLVLLEAVAIGLLGGLGGVLVSIAGARLVAAAMKERVGLVIDPALPPMIAAGVVLGAVALAAAAGIVPAAMAYRTSVAKNLKPLG